jgi:hypothetical protein
MAEISEAQLDLIAARAEAATPGPWEAFVFPNPNDEDFIRTGGLDDNRPDLYLQHEPPGGPRMAVPEADLDFIAAGHGAVTGIGFSSVCGRRTPPLRQGTRG